VPTTGMSGFEKSLNLGCLGPGSISATLTVTMSVLVIAKCLWPASVAVGSYRSAAVMVMADGMYFGKSPDMGGVAQGTDRSAAVSVTVGGMSLVGKCLGLATLAPGSQRRAAVPVPASGTFLRQKMSGVDPRGAGRLQKCGGGGNGYRSVFREMSEFGQRCTRDG
jgi:hypothetical protein